MPDLTKIKWPKDVPTWIGLAGLLGQAIYLASQKDYQGAWTALSAAFVLLGIGAQAATAAVFAKRADTAAGFAANDTMAIRNDPSMPGPVMTSRETSARSAMASKADAL